MITFILPAAAARTRVLADARPHTNNNQNWTGGG